MRPVIIGAGRGSRLQDRTSEVPKTMVSVMGRPMLEWILDALGEAGFSRRDVVFICGYRSEVIKERYPEFTFVDNHDWANNNILLSLLCAREHLGAGFVSTYADIVYRGSIVRDLVASPASITLACDTDWRRRYVHRFHHPETDAEKMRASGPDVTELSRRIPSAEAAGEFIGVARFDRDGAAALCESFDRAAEAHRGQVFREGRTFERAYLIDLLQWMIERGVAMRRADTHGGYMELDTLEDLSLAEAWWAGKEK